MKKLFPLILLFCALPALAVTPMSFGDSYYAGVFAQDAVIQRGYWTVPLPPGSVISTLADGTLATKLADGEIVPVTTDQTHVVMPVVFVRWDITAFWGTTSACSITAVPEFLNLITGKSSSVWTAVTSPTPNGSLWRWSGTPPAGINPWCTVQ